MEENKVKVSIIKKCPSSQKDNISAVRFEFGGNEQLISLYFIPKIRFYVDSVLYNREEIPTFAEEREQCAYNLLVKIKKIPCDKECMELSRIMEAMHSADELKKICKELKEMQIEIENHIYKIKDQYHI